MGHNIAKIETHEIHGVNCQCAVHRKGATRARPGQPVLVPGDIGAASWLLEGVETNTAFNSSCHGAGRLLSRSQAKKVIDGQELKNDWNPKESESTLTRQIFLQKKHQIRTKMLTRLLI